MSDLAISVRGLSKQYRLGIVGAGSLQHDLSRWLARMRGAPDPYAKVTEVNDRTRAGHSDYVWALQGVDFDVRRGELLGIIGRNGAGKSTLLKVLSRVTAPTAGEVRIKGRMASLLEVGTGFHPELTGRNNIFLNGAILGMTKSEVASKFDSIVEFSGCQRYIDTPVKRYSSGMYVRLAFAVAAHLEPEILVVDEVLAVGDAEFQKKCIGKMRDVAGHGRTVLFVSHNMQSISALTRRTLVMDGGQVAFDGPTDEAIQHYLERNAQRSMLSARRPIESIPHDKRHIADRRVVFAEIGIAADSAASFPSGGDLGLDLTVDAESPVECFRLGYTIKHASGVPVINGFTPPVRLPYPGRHLLRVLIEALPLAPGEYELSMSTGEGAGAIAQRHYDMLLGFGHFLVEQRTREGEPLPDWQSGWGKVIHNQSRVLLIEERHVS